MKTDKPKTKRSGIKELKGKSKTIRKDVYLSSIIWLINQNDSGIDNVCIR